MRVWTSALILAAAATGSHAQPRAPYIAAGAITTVSQWDSSINHPRGANELRTAMLNAHNQARQQVGIAELSWDDSLAREATAYAQVVADSRRFEHSERDGEGENLWMGTSRAYAYREMIASWVDERADYVPGRFPQVSRSGAWSDVAHYTQVIWAGTRTVGCGTANNGEDEVLVCRYFPAGNVYGEVATDYPRTRSASFAQARAR